VTNSLKRSGNLVEALGSALREGGHAVGTVPGLIRRILEEGSWREFVTQRGEHVQHERFVSFVEAAPLRGIGAKLDLIKRMVADDPAVVDLLDRELVNPQGGSAAQRSTVSVSNSGRPSGTTKQYALRRLRRDAPELHAEVVAGSLSAHAAMVRAGLRPKTFTLRIDSAEQVANALKEKLPDEVLSDVLKRLSE